MSARDRVARELAASGGVLRLDPALVARAWLPPGRRLGIPDADYDLGERGFVCERWLGSTTRADHAVGPDDEGLSFVRFEAETDGGASGDSAGHRDSGNAERMTLADAIAEAGDLILGAEYFATHGGLGRLAKIFDYGERVPFHIHPPLEEARRVERNSKDEAYYFPSGVPMGPHPETFFGLHPWIAESADPGAVLLPHLEQWCDAEILKHSVAYQQVAEEGFFISSGVLHAPGTALTIELQEDSDTLSMFQALNAGTIISKDLLFKDIPAVDREQLAERAPLRWVDWDANCDPQFYAKRKITPVPIPTGTGADLAWIFCGTTKFSGKRLRVQPGARITLTERGVFTALVWRGDGTIAGRAVRGNTPGEDELLVSHAAAVAGCEVVNTGDVELVVILFFGPDINPDAPPAGFEARQ